MPTFKYKEKRSFSHPSGKSLRKKCTRLKDFLGYLWDVFEIYEIFLRFMVFF